VPYKDKSLGTPTKHGQHRVSFRNPGNLCKEMSGKYYGGE
jgi:hypothetical protein